MKREKLLDSKGKPITGLYYLDLKSGRNIYARFNIPTAPQFVNLTKEFGVKTISKAKEKRNELIQKYHNPNADHITNKQLINTLIEKYISERPVNLRHPHRSQRKLVENRYKLYLEPYLKYITVDKFNSKHLGKVKANLDNRKVGLQTYQKLRTLIRSSLKGTGINFDRLFSDFEPNKKFTETNKKKFKIDEYFTEHLEDVANTFYEHFVTLYETSKLKKEKDRYAFFLYLLLTASRVGETARLKLKDVELFDKKNNIYRIIIPKDVNKNSHSREIKIPSIIVPFVKDRIATASSNDYLFQTDIENVLPYHFKKSLKLFKLKETKGLQVHIFRALFRNIAIDRELNIRAVDYIMDRQRTATVDEKYYDASLTHQQRYNVYQTLFTYEKICRGELEKQSLDFSQL